MILYITCCLYSIWHSQYCKEVFKTFFLFGECFTAILIQLLSLLSSSLMDGLARSAVYNVHVSPNSLKRLV